jgi:acetyl-CoA acetyltransferase
LLPEIATVPDGLAASVPVKAEPSDIDTETAATVVPAAALSDRDAALGVKLMPVGMALTWTGIEPETVTLF